jgi:hypothetical protein
MSRPSAMDQPAIYRISVQGRLGDDWAAVFEPLQIRYAAGPDGAPLTVLTGPLADQAALHGALQKLYALCLPLLSVEIASGEETSSQ